MVNFSKPGVPLIVMMTDFGLSDPFVGIMKGVINSIAPQAQIIDLTQEIPPGDVLRGAVTLWQSREYFRPGTIFLGVIDPGVGTARRPVLVSSKEQVFVGPDNGLFSFVLEKDCQAWELQNTQFALPGFSKTFHGRDIFAPAAAHAATGVPGSDFGSPAGSLTRLSTPHLHSPTPEILEGEILYPDRFGNLLTSLGRFTPKGDDSFHIDPWVGDVGTGIVRETINSCFRLEDFQLRLPDGKALQWVNTFAEAPAEGCAFLVGSSGLLEIAAYRKSAAEILGLQTGDRVTLRFQGER